MLHFRVLRLIAILLPALALTAPSLAIHADDGNSARLHLPLVAAAEGGAPVATGLEPVLLAALEEMAVSDPARYGEMTLASVRSAGGSALAVARAPGAASPVEVALLAAFSDAAGWRIVATSEDPASEFNAGLDAMPAALLDEGDKAFLRRSDPPQDTASGLAPANFGGHSLPWPGGQIGYLMQKDGNGHESQLDFDILGNSASGDVYASKAGVVVFAKQSSAGGCPSLLCWQQANMVVVQHDTGEYSWYVHLAPNSVTVRSGDRVTYGVKIGVEGSTGYSLGVHLHYMVSTGHTTWTPPEDAGRAPWALGIQRVDFGEAAWEQLTVGQRYTSQNRREEKCDGPSPAADQIALYEHANYCGIAALLGAGDYPNPAALGFPNDRASSLRVGSDVAAMLCRDDGFGGVCETVSADVADLTGSKVGNDQVSSVRVMSKVKLAPPGTPALVRPVAGELIAAATVALAWSAEPAAVAYAVQIAATPAFTSLTANLRLGGTGTSIASLPEGIHFWRVRARNAADLWGEWSEPGVFVLDAPPYFSPHPERPAYAALRNTPSIQFTWLDSEPAAQYRLQAFAAAQNDSGAAAPVVDDLAGGLSHTPPLLADGEYTWRVCRVEAGKPAPACSEPRPLTVDTQPPQPPVPAYPDGAVLTERARAFAWAPVSDAVEYHLQAFVGDGVQTGFAVGPQTLAPFLDIRTGETAYTPARLPDGLYGWRVRGRDAAGNWSAWSEPRTVTMVAPTSWSVYLPAVSRK